MFNNDVIILDDADLLDRGSWIMLLDMLSVPGAIFVMTLPSAIENIFPEAEKYLKNSLVTIAKLSNLPGKAIAPLTCQMLGVDAIPSKLIR